jgi:hypothetical protein
VARTPPELTLDWVLGVIGKEGVSGSSPEEGFAKSRKAALSRRESIAHLQCAMGVGRPVAHLRKPRAAPASLYPDPSARANCRTSSARERRPSLRYTRVR